MYAARPRSGDAPDREDGAVVRPHHLGGGGVGLLLYLCSRASGNPVFHKIIEEIRDALARQSTFLNQLGDRRRQSDLEHRALVEAIVGGSEGAAVQAMAAHLEHVEITLNTIVRPGTAQHPPE